MRGHPLPLLVGELAGLLQQIERDARFADVVHQRGEAELIQLELGHAETAAERDREDAHVHRVRERVFVVVADRRQTDERGLLVQHLIHDSLHHSLDLSDVRRLADAHRVDDVLGDGNGLRVGAVGRGLRFLVELPVGLRLGRRVDLERLDLRVLQALHDFVEPLCRRALRFATQKRQQQRPVLGGSLRPDMDCADAGDFAEREDVSECGVVAEIEPESGRVDENELSRDPELELTLFGAQLLGDL